MNPQSILKKDSQKSKIENHTKQSLPLFTGIPFGKKLQGIVSTALGQSSLAERKIPDHLHSVDLD